MQYRVEVHPTPVVVTTAVESVLNQRAAEGWRLVSAVLGPKPEPTKRESMHDLMLIFERN